MDSVTRRLLESALSDLAAAATELSRGDNVGAQVRIGNAAQQVNAAIGRAAA